MKKSTLTICMLAFCGLFLAGCGNGPPDKPAEYGTVQTAGTGSFCLPEALSSMEYGNHTILPEDGYCCMDIPEGYEFLAIPSAMMSVCHPSGMETEVTDPYTAVFKGSGDTVIYLKRLYSENFEDTESIARYGKDHVLRLKYYSGGQTYKGMLFDHSEYSVSETADGFTVITETPKVTMITENGSSTFIPYAAVSYIDIDSDSYIIVAFSGTLPASELTEMTETMADSIHSYLPPAQSADITGGMPQNIGGGLSACFPDVYTVSNKKGFIKAECREPESLFFGTDIYVFRGESRDGADVVSLPQQTSQRLLSVRYEGFNGDFLTDVESFSDIGKDPGTVCLFDMKDTVYPHTAAETDLLPPEGNVLRSYRLSFNDHSGTPVVLICTYTSKTETVASDLLIHTAETIKDIKGDQE